MTLVDVVRPHRSDRPNLSILKNSHARAIRFNTLTAICDALGCTRANPSVSNADRPATEPRPTQLTATRNSLPIHHPGDHAATTREPASAPRGQRRVDPTVPSRLLLRSRRW